MRRLAALEDSLKATLKKYENTDKENIKRIEALEERLGGKVANHVEAAVDIQLRSRLEGVEAKLKGTVAGVKSELESSGQRWMLPFAAVVFAIFAVAVFSYRGISKIAREKLP